MTAIDSNGCIEFTPKQITCPKWPVRITAMQGLWRYVQQMPWPNQEYVEVIGPYFPGSPERNGGRSRIVRIELLKYAGRLAKPVDVTDVQVTAISDDAKRARRR